MFAGAKKLSNFICLLIRRNSSNILHVSANVNNRFCDHAGISLPKTFVAVSLLQ